MLRDWQPRSARYLSTDIYRYSFVYAFIDTRWISTENIHRQTFEGIEDIHQHLNRGHVYTRAYGACLHAIDFRDQDIRTSIYKYRWNILTSIYKY